MMGLGVGLLGTNILGQFFPDFPVSTPAWAMVGGVGVAIVTGLVFGILPAKRAAKLDPVQSLSRR